MGLLDDPATRAAVQAERALLNGTGGGCRSPIGALGLVDAGTITLDAAAERTWTPGPGATIHAAPVVWVHGTDPVTRHRELASRLAARIVLLRERPRVLTGRPAGQAATLVEALDAAGVDALNVPAIEVVAEAAGGPLDDALRDARPGQRVVVTSPNGARAILAAAARLGVDPRGFSWAAVGEGTAAVLATAAIADPFVPTHPDGMTLAAELPVRPGEPILLPRADIADETLPDGLRARGAAVTSVVAYRTIEAPETSREALARALDDGPVDAIVVTSASAVRGFRALATADPAVSGRIRGAAIVAVGAPSAAAARSLGFEPVLIAPSPDPASLATFVADALGAAAPGTVVTDPVPAGATR